MLADGSLGAVRMGRLKLEEIREALRDGNANLFTAGLAKPCGLDVFGPTTQPGVES